jgi:hypothetical protein
MRGAALFVLLVSCGARASAQEHRFEVSANTRNASPPFVFQGSVVLFRAPAPAPSFESTDKQDLWLTGVDVRAYWMKRLSLIIQASFGNEPNGHFAFVQTSPPPGPDFPVEETVKPQVWTVSLLQSVDPVGRGRVRPWVGGGITLVHAVDRQQLTLISLATLRFAQF